jgi:hypothetical protein
VSLSDGERLQQSPAEGRFDGSLELMSLGNAGSKHLTDIASDKAHDNPVSHQGTESFRLCVEHRLTWAVGS